MSAELKRGIAAYVTATILGAALGALHAPWCALLFVVALLVFFGPPFIFIGPREWRRLWAERGGSA